MVDVDAYEPAVLNQPVTAPSLEYSAGGDARQVAFNPLADLLVGGRAESDDRFLEFGSLEPLLGQHSRGVQSRNSSRIRKPRSEGVPGDSNRLFVFPYTHCHIRFLSC